LLRIEQELGPVAHYAGPAAFKSLSRQANRQPAKL
jgi:hypothetical protein